MSQTTVKGISAEEFASLPGDPPGVRRELVRGEIVLTPSPGFSHGLRQGRIFRLLDDYARSTGSGRVVVESGVIVERDPDTVRGPDVSYWSAARLPLDQEPEGYPDSAPDLCVEVLSPNDKPATLRNKLSQYFTRGVRAVWVVDRNARHVTVYRSTDDGRVFDETATLSGEDVLPGFTCQVADIFS